MKRIFYLLILLFCNTFIQAQNKTDSNKLSTKSSQLRFDVLLKDGGVFHGSSEDKKAYIVTEYAIIKLRLSEIDSVEIGILADYFKEKKISSLLKKLSSGNKEEQEKAYKRLISMNIGALPVIRNYIERDTIDSPQSTVDSKFNAINVLKELEAKFKVSKDFIDRDIIYMHSGFKVGGIFSFRKKRALIKFGSFVFPREDIRKIINFHEVNK